ncbi:MAG: DUF2203 domain-containing protein [Chloroflexi bacterium]|nr:DUF2203 domain-containing protein [Chloroflexota bacterium]
MTPHYFTLEEANQTIIHIRPLMAELLKRRARVVSCRPYLLNALEDLHSNTGSALATTVAQDFAAMERLLARIKAYGCVIKDINVGLVDFLTERSGREVYLCWRFGEEGISFYHDLHTGFNSRRPV